jgi:mRNA interferase MazF
VVRLRRGDLVVVALPGDFGKPRPALVVQADLFLAVHPTVTVLPITSEIRDVPLFRITVDPSRPNGLRKVSQIMIDKPMTFRRDKIGAPIGRLDDDHLVRVNRALVLWLGIAG